jgi:hypothetical protein
MPSVPRTAALKSVERNVRRSARNLIAQKRDIPGRSRGIDQPPWLVEQTFLWVADPGRVRGPESELQT